MIAIYKASELRRKELHENERPIALQTVMHANINRDVKKRKQPYELTEYCIYGDTSDEKLPNPSIGAAAMKLVSMSMFPNWALFAYKDLKATAENGVAPEFLALICEDAILLAPQGDTGGFYGMLIALESSSGAIREMISPCGKVYQLLIPKLDAKASAIEDVFLKVI